MCDELLRPRDLWYKYIIVDFKGTLLVGAGSVYVPKLRGRMRVRLFQEEETAEEERAMEARSTPV